MSDEAVSLRDLIVIFEELEPDAKTVLMRIAGRLQHGQLMYGHLDIATDKRNWPREIGEEFYDALVYHTIGLLKKEREA